MSNITVIVTAIHEGMVRTWHSEVREDDEYLADRMPQAGNDLLLAAAVTAVHTYDIFPPRKD